MNTTEKKEKLRVVAIGPEEHKRLAIMAAHSDRNLGQFVSELINERWAKFETEDKTNGKTEK